jgi:hypothetical protein
MNKSKLKQVATVTGLFLGAFTISVLAAGEWTPATCTAPDCNASAPLNVSEYAQEKKGGISITGGGQLTATGASLDVNGSGFFSGLIVSGRVEAESLKINSAGKDVQGNVLTTDGTGLAEWKPISANGGNGGNGGAGGFTPTVAEFSSSIVVSQGMGQLPKTNVTDITGGYKYCSLSNFYGSGVGGGTSQPGSQCSVYKSGSDWKLSSTLNPGAVVNSAGQQSASLTCQAVCFK